MKKNEIADSALNPSESANVHSSDENPKIQQSHDSDQEQPHIGVAERLFPGAEAVDPDLADIGIMFARERCLFCKRSSNECSAEAKRDMMSTDHRGSAQRYCSGFRLSPIMCRVVLCQFLDDHPEFSESIVNCDPDSDPLAGIKPGESVF